MTVVAAVAYLLISAGAVLTVLRLVQGPSLADRIVATDLLLVLLTCGTGVYAYDTGDGIYLIVMVIVGVLGFLGTVTVARFIEKRGA
ncbi:MAG: monovalent cation/H+ antiporter complex subunit F [Acidimicrobiales bacterium]|nr:monovalent cation/H+ antiporter complex subunit F [Acidimicrobiales bacterium]